MNYYALGYLFGVGRKKRAAQNDVWKDLRSLAWFGMCDCERKLQNFDMAIDYCQRSLTYDPKDPYAHFALATAFTYKANKTQSAETIPAAVKHFCAVLELDPDLQEADYARKTIVNIEKAVPTDLPAKCQAGMKKTAASPGGLPAGTLLANQVK